jgi:hypothetical protein
MPLLAKADLRGRGWRGWTVKQHFVLLCDRSYGFGEWWRRLWYLKPIRPWRWLSLDFPREQITADQARSILKEEGIL